MERKMLKFGILGTGMASDFHAISVNELDGAELLGVCDINLERAEAFAKKHGGKVYQSLEEMLADGELDAVSVCTPSGYHAEAVIASARAGKHIVCEKPLAISTSDVDRIIDACRESSVKLTVMSQFRFSADIKKAHDIVQSGVLGKLVMCDLYMKYWRDPSYYASSNWRGTKAIDGGAALINQGFHGVDLFLYIVGNAKVRASVAKASYHSIEAEDVAVALLSFDNGAEGVIEASTCAYPGFARRMEIIGTKGHLILTEGSIERLFVDGETLIDNKSIASATSSDPMAMPYDNHKAQYQNFINAVNGKEELLVTAEESRKALKIIEDVYRLNGVK
ncbi:MAG: Gfo/Idh/MocA family oxidoreductase [Clostridia bacterium]|nr:Gfo/Idh/MocA family oxidoreductase [Clostridia bacterium]